MKAQVSVEFIIIFAVILLVFTTFGYVFLDNYEKSTSTNGLAQSYVDDLKARFISVSLSPVDVVVNLTIPQRFNGIKINVYIYKSDNLLIIKKEESGALMATSNLPRLESATDGTPLNPALKLTITKKNNKITVTNT